MSPAKHGGTLVYAGGDDVLALVPAKAATTCAADLRNEFRRDFNPQHGRILPGHATDVSCGIAIGHHRTPLQTLVREAQRLEHVAKENYAKGAFTISVFKRSGEILQWGGKWDSAALPLVEALAQERERWLKSKGTAGLSERFPYALSALLAPYSLNGALQDGMCAVIRAEVTHALSRQGRDIPQSLVEIIGKWLTETAYRAEDFIAPFLTECFINRDRSKNSD